VHLTKHDQIRNLHVLIKYNVHNINMASSMLLL